MAKKKQKPPEEMGEIERIWYEEEQAKKKAEKLTKNTSKNPAKDIAKPSRVKALNPELEPFFTHNEAHKYGTCWKCGDPRLHAGGSPGGSESYFCPRCNAWLPIRDSRKDQSWINIIP